MSIVRIDPGGGRNAEHIAIIVVVDLVPIQCHFRSRRPQAQHPFYSEAIVSKRPHGHTPSSKRPQARGMTATGLGRNQCLGPTQCLGSELRSSALRTSVTDGKNNAEQPHRS